MIKYRLGVIGIDAWGEPKSLIESRSALRNRAERHGPGYQVGRRDDPVVWGPRKGLRRATRSLYSALSNRQTGDVMYLKCDDGLTFRVHKVNVTPPVTNTEGNDKVDKFYSAVMANFEGVYDFGIYNCRHIDGSSTWSQHAFHNAWDFGSKNGSAGISEIVNWAKAHAGEFDIDHLLWQGHNVMNGYPVDDHYDHGHVDFVPNGTGTPPCA